MSDGFRRVHRGVAYRGKHFEIMFAARQFYPCWRISRVGGDSINVNIGRSLLWVAWWK